MERGSDKHGSRLDEDLKQATRSVVQGSTEARADENREQEGPADGEPTPDARIAGGVLQTNDAFPTDDELEARTDLARHLDPSVFPADREALVASARRNFAPDWVVESLGVLSPDQTYPNTEAVWEALGGSREERGA